MYKSIYFSILLSNDCSERIIVLILPEENSGSNGSNGQINKFCCHSMPFLLLPLKTTQIYDNSDKWLKNL